MSARRRAARWSGLRGLDERLMSRSADARSKILDGTLVALTRAASYSRLWLLIAGVLAFSGRERARRAAADGLLATAIAAVIVNGPAKLLVRRRRPSRPSSPPLIVMPRTSSFPSGHSASAFAFATGASCAWPLLAPALLPVCTTRPTSPRGRRSAPARD